MNRRGNLSAEALPWRATLTIDAIPEAGLHQEITAGPAELESMRKLSGLRQLSGARARFELSHAGRGRVRAVGRVVAVVGQTCVVTLEPMDSAVDEPIEALFVPVDEVDAVTKAMDKEAEATGQVPDPPEPIVNGMIDLGKLASDALFLAIDPYPRKPDAVFEPPAAIDDPDSHPFAALKALTGKSSTKPDEN